MHVTIRTEEEDVLFSTRGQDGGNGQALAFMLNEGQRAPRAWEIVNGGTHGLGRVCINIQKIFSVYISKG